MKQYPEELTLDEFDDMDWKIDEDFSLNDSPLSENQLIKRMQTYAKKHHAVIYTQVDGSEDRVYIKGLQRVNRTGIYAVVKL